MNYCPTKHLSFTNHKIDCFGNTHCATRLAQALAFSSLRFLHITQELVETKTELNRLSAHIL